MSIGIRPLYDRIVVKRDEATDKTPGGVYVVETSREKPKKGTVVAVGTGRVLENGNTLPLVLKAGDRVIFGAYAGSEIEVGGEKFTIMKETDVVGTIEGDDDTVDAGTSTTRRSEVSSFYQ